MKFKLPSSIPLMPQWHHTHITIKCVLVHFGFHNILSEFEHFYSMKLFNPLVNRRPIVTDNELFHQYLKFNYLIYNIIDNFIILNLQFIDTCHYLGQVGHIINLSTYSKNLIEECSINIPLLTTHNTSQTPLPSSQPTCCDNLLYYILFIKYFIFNITKT